MSLFKEQHLFMMDLAKLLVFSESQGFMVSGRELGRTPEQQQIYVKTGRSTTFNSKHLNNLAIDLYFMKDGILIYDVSLLQPLGDYWQSLSPNNSAGMFWKSFKDVPHFERRV